MKKVLLLLLALVVGIMWIWFSRRPMTSPMSSATIPIVRKTEGASPAPKQVHTVPSPLHPAHTHYTGLTP